MNVSTNARPWHLFVSRARPSTDRFAGHLDSAGGGTQAAVAYADSLRVVWYPRLLSARPGALWSSWISLLR
jgi:hypothetical protein